MLQSLQAHFQSLLQPLYDLIEQVRFFVAILLGVLLLLSFAQTLENRATFVSRLVYLCVFWLLLPISFSLFDAFSVPLGFSSREAFAPWQPLFIALLFVLFVASYATALFFAYRKKQIFDGLLFLIALMLVAHRVYQRYFL